MSELFKRYGISYVWLRVQLIMLIAGVCHFGINCRFLHVNPNRNTFAANNTQGWTVCKYFLKGKATEENYTPLLTLVQESQIWIEL